MSLLVASVTLHSQAKTALRLVNAVVGVGGLYGPTEVTLWVTAASLGQSRPVALDQDPSSLNLEAHFVWLFEPCADFGVDTALLLHSSWAHNLQR